MQPLQMPSNANAKNMLTPQYKQAVGGRPPRYAPAPLLTSWAPKCLAPPSRRQRSSSFQQPTRSHAHRYSRLTCQHGGEQSSLVTLTLDLLTLKVVSQSRVMWATSVPILVFLGLSILDLGPMYVTDRRQTDVRQHHRLMPPPKRGRGIITRMALIGEHSHANASQIVTIKQAPGKTHPLVCTMTQHIPNSTPK